MGAGSEPSPCAVEKEQPRARIAEGRARSRRMTYENERQTDAQLKNLITGVLKDGAQAANQQSTRRTCSAMKSQKKTIQKLTSMRNASSFDSSVKLKPSLYSILVAVAFRYRAKLLSLSSRSTSRDQSASRSAWASAMDTVASDVRNEVTKFNLWLRRGLLWRQDPPGHYELTIYHAPKIKRNRLLVKLVAKKLGNEYFIGHSTIGQHSLQWFQPIVDPSGTIIPQGSINLYQYPMVSLNGQLPVEVAGKMLHAIRWLVHKVAEEPNRVFYRRDASGALPLHALAISNTPSALVLIREICSLWPRMIPLVHGPGLYEGEHLFHILAVNQREEELCELLCTAHLRLGRGQWNRMLERTPVGIFFLGFPMSFFGSTIVAFAAAFGLKRVIHTIFKLEEADAKSIGAEAPIRLTDTKYACPITGFMPIHCAVANGQLQMYDFLTGANHHLAKKLDEIRIPCHLLALVTQRTVHGLRERWSMLTPLQLAAKLGDKRMTRHILRKRLALNWKWGPLSSYRINLAEVDSVHAEGQVCASIIELVADFTAALETQRLLLDDFMHGFIYALVQQKWMQFTRYIFYTIRLFELGYLVALNVLCFLLKLEPCFRSIALAMGVLVVSLLLAALEIALMVLWWRKDVTLGFESLRGFRRKLRRLSLWARAFSWRGKMLGFACTSAACARYLATAEERMAGKHTSADDAPLYLLFGVSSYFQGKAFISSISVSPSLPNMGVQMFIIDKMFHNDVTTYLIFLCGFTINYYLAMYISIPANEDMQSRDLVKGSFVEFQMSNPVTGFHAMVEQAIVGMRFSPDWHATVAVDFTAVEWLCFCFFFLVHLSFNVVCIILLMRLLMAMMTNTFRTVQESAQLEWRLLITRHVLRFELLGAAFFPANGDLAARLLAGAESPVDGKYYYHFLDVQTPDGAPKTVPMLKAQPAEHEPLFADDDAVSRPKASSKYSPLFHTLQVRKFKGKIGRSSKGICQVSSEIGRSSKGSNQVSSEFGRSSKGSNQISSEASEQVSQQQDAGSVNLTTTLSQWRTQMKEEFKEMLAEHNQMLAQQYSILQELARELKGSAQHARARFDYGNHDADSRIGDPEMSA